MEDCARCVKVKKVAWHAAHCLRKGEGTLEGHMYVSCVMTATDEENLPHVKGMKIYSRTPVVTFTVAVIKHRTDTTHGSRYISEASVGHGGEDTAQ